MRVAVHQPNYVPWSGFFAKMLVSDVFIFFDDVQLPQGRSYVSRAKIAKGKDDEQWLTVPVSKSGSPTIDRVTIADAGFGTKHLSTLRHSYAKTPHLDDILGLVAPVYGAAGESLADLNMALIRAVARYLGYQGTFLRSSEHPSDLAADARIADLVAWAGGDVYVSGAGGENYQSEETYRARGVQLEVRKYVPVEYDRSGWSWVPGLSCLDALFHCGPAAAGALIYL
jgi:hypothetical protein